MQTIIKKSLANGEHPIAKHFNFQKKKIFFGPMGAWKTTHLISELETLTAFIEQEPPEEPIQLLAYKPTIDTRKIGGASSESTLASRLVSYPCKLIEDPLQIQDDLKWGRYNIIVYDEVQFGPSSILDLIDIVDMHSNLYLIIAALNLNFRGQPYPLSDFKKTMMDVIKRFSYKEMEPLTAICNACGDKGATHTQRARIEEGIITPVPYWDVLHKLGGSEVHLDEQGKADIYQARHAWEFKTPGKETWDLLELMFKQYGAKGHRVPLQQVLENSCVDPALFDTIVKGRFVEEKILEIVGDKAHYVKGY